MIDWALKGGARMMWKILQGHFLVEGDTYPIQIGGIALSSGLPSTNRHEADQYRSLVRARLSDRSFEETWRTGQTLSLEPQLRDLLTTK